MPDRIGSHTVYRIRAKRDELLTIRLIADACTPELSRDSFPQDRADRLPDLPEQQLTPPRVDPHTRRISRWMADHRPCESEVRDDAWNRQTRRSTLVRADEVSPRSTTDEAAMVGLMDGRCDWTNACETFVGGVGFETMPAVGGSGSKMRASVKLSTAL